MTGIFTSIGAGTIGVGVGLGVARFVSTRDWIRIAAQSVHSFFKKHAPYFQTSVGTIAELRRILYRVDELAGILPADEQPQIRTLMADLQQRLARIAAIEHIHHVVQNLDASIARAAPEAEITERVAELEAAANEFCGTDGGTASLQEEREECRDQAYVLCGRLRRILNRATANETWTTESDVRQVVKQLQDQAGELLEMSLPGTDN